MVPGRRIAKTAQLILYTHLYDRHIVCLSEYKKQRIMEVAKTLGISIKEPIVQSINKE